MGAPRDTLGLTTAFGSLRHMQAVNWKERRNAQIYKYLSVNECKLSVLAIFISTRGQICYAFLMDKMGLQLIHIGTSPFFPFFSFLVL
jgi:hypothetical protein